MLRFGRTCNNNCVFCMTSEEHMPPEHFSLDNLKRRLLEAKESGKDSVEFFGGEATIHRNFLPALKFAKEIGLKRSVASNARIFSYDHFC